MRERAVVERGEHITIAAQSRALLIAVALLAGCGDSAEAPDAAVPDLARPPICTADEIGDAGVPATFANVERIFDGTCATGVCHFTGFSVPQGIGIDLSHGHAYASIVGKVAPDPPNQCGGPIVTPFHPEQSYLMVKLTKAQGEQCNPKGEQMPICDVFACPLDECAIDLVRRWILAGAPPE
ncbi:MAG TPA: hypothetical protein VFF06_14720 [Polyangia bacterium]|nr:hypothetical protein [Polyangia bacterium]